LSVNGNESTTKSASADDEKVTENAWHVLANENHGIARDLKIEARTEIGVEVARGKGKESVPGRLRLKSPPSTPR
jgi:hypothetical protein